MAFIQKDFSLVGGEASRGTAPVFHVYKTSDTLMTVKTTAGYFNKIGPLLTAGDRLLAYTSGGSQMALISVATVVNGVVAISGFDNNAVV